MAREMKIKQKIELIDKLNKEFKWNLKASNILILTDKTSGAYKWYSINLYPQIHSEYCNASKIILAKNISYIKDDDGTIDIMDEPFTKSSYFQGFGDKFNINFSYL